MARWVIKPESSSLLEQMRETTPARIGVGRAGTRSPTDVWLRFRLDHAMARDAVRGEFSESFLSYVQEQGYPLIQSQAVDKPDFISFPPKGKKTDPTTIAQLKAACPSNLDAQIVVSDGLSAMAIEDNIRDLLPMVKDGLQLEGISFGVPIVVRYGRVAIGDQLGHELNMKLSIILIGERPGMSYADSMSAYLTYNPGPETISSDRTVVSNIHSHGTLPVEAGAYIVQLAKKILTVKKSGVRLQQHC